MATSERIDALFPLVERYGSSVIPIELDVNDELADRETVQHVLESFDRVDVVVNNAGYDSPELDATARTALEQVQRNLFGALWVTHAALEYMRRAGKGRIVLVVFGPTPAGAGDDEMFLERTRSVFDRFAEYLAREVAASHITMTICVPAERIAEWLVAFGPRTYTLSPFTSTWN